MPSADPRLGHVVVLSLLFGRASTLGGCVRLGHFDCMLQILLGCIWKGKESAGVSRWLNSLVFLLSLLVHLVTL